MVEIIQKIKEYKKLPKYNPDYLLFYVKGKKKFFHPDEHHSVRVNEVNSYTDIKHSYKIDKIYIKPTD